MEIELLSHYDYVLPQELIAQEPLEDRSAAKLLMLNRNTGTITHKIFKDIPQLLHKGDLLILNNTRVTALRLFGHKLTGAKVEALLLQSRQENEYVALMKPGKRLQPGTEVDFENGVRAIIKEDLGDGKKLLVFAPQENLLETLNQIGQIPLPHYIKKQLYNIERYQTVYSSIGGSSAAPTAGLHFVPDILKKLIECGIEIAYVTLDVSIDTFRPIQAEKLSEVVMHGETCMISEETATKVSQCTGKIIAVGTTTVRTLESFATAHRQVEAGKKNTNIFIFPGYKFKIVDGMLTNFHMPRTSMLMMISALAGRQNIFHAYDEAKLAKYRFLSFGDSMLIL